jgi:asparagine synthase (glutamine-hydrolysing)
VVLSGEGGDEGFAGYHLYSIFSRIETIKQKMPSPFSAGLRYCRFGRWERIYKYLDWLTLPVNDAYRGISADLTQSFKPVMYTKDFYQNKGNYLDTVFESYFKQTQGADILSKLLYVDAKTWLVDDLLLKADKMTMGASVELRVPFLDHKLMEFAARLPSHYKLYKKEGKYILKKSMEDRLPHHIIYRKKMGFPVPINQWFGKELYLHAKDILLSSKSIQRGYIHPDYIKRLFKSQETGKGRSGRRIFSLLNLELWHRKYIDR